MSSFSPAQLIEPGSLWDPPNQIAQFDAGNARTIPGQTLLLAGVCPGLTARSFYTPVPLEGLASAVGVYGLGRFLRGMGEALRQGAPSILVSALPSADALAGAFDWYRDIDFDVLCPVGFNQSDVGALESFVVDREQAGRPITVVLAVDPSPGVGALVASPPASSLQAGRSFVFTLDQLTINPNLPAEYQADAAPSIAGLMVRGAPQISVLAQPFAGVRLPSLYAQADAQALAGAGYLTIRQSARKGYIPYLDVTGTSSDPNSLLYAPQLHRLSTSRTVQYVTGLVTKEVGGLVGAALGTYDLRGALTDLLTELTREGVLVAYDILGIVVYEVLGTVQIDLAILPPYETSAVSVRAQVNFRRPA